MPRLTEVRKNAINTFDADYATMCHRLNEPDEQVPSSNQPQLRGQVNALGWEREDEHHQKNVLGLAQDARQTTFSNENNYNDYNTYQGGKGWKRKYHWGKGENPITSATTISLGAEREAKEARVAKRTTIRTDKLDWSYLARGILARANQHTRDENVRSGRRNNAPERTVTWPTNHTSTISAEWERKNKPTLLKPKLRINNADTTTPTT